MRQSIYLFSLLSLLLFMGGCNDEETVNENDYYFREIENEVVTTELTDAPAYVWLSTKDVTIICYSQYAVEYGELYLVNREFDNKDEKALEIYYDLKAHCIGVPTVDYEQYQIGLNENVYITASITNNNKRTPIEKSDGRFSDLVGHVYGYEAYKAYLHHIKLYNE